MASESWLGYGDNVVMAHCPSSLSSHDRRTLKSLGWNEQIVELFPYVWKRTNEECARYSELWRSQYTNTRLAMRIASRSDVSSLAMKDNMPAISGTFLNHWLLSHSSKKDFYSFLPEVMKRRMSLECSEPCLESFLMKYKVLKRKFGIHEELFNIAIVMEYLLRDGVAYENVADKLEKILLSYGIERNSKSYFLSMVDTIRSREKEQMASRTQKKLRTAIASYAIEKLCTDSECVCELEILFTDTLNNEPSAVRTLEYLFIVVDSLYDFIQDYSESIQVLLGGDKLLGRTIVKETVNKIYNRFYDLMRLTEDKLPLGISNAIGVWDNLNHMTKTIINIK